jgi:uncharacterized protein YndB with AHSA1/START domain
MKMCANTRAITKSIEVNASSDIVFKALTDEKEIEQWFANAGVRFDPRTGGNVEIRTRRPDTGQVNTVRGKIVEFIQGKKVSYTWSGDSDAARAGFLSVVTWSLEAIGEGKTRITLVHSGLPEDEKKYKETVMGWAYFTGRLAEFCKDRNSGIIRKTIIIDVSVDIVFSALTDPEQLTNWFPDQAKLEPKVGGAVQFNFFDDNGKDVNHTVEGRILELVPNQKIVYTWKNLTDPKFPNTVVSWSLEAVGNNSSSNNNSNKQTKVTLVHSGFDPKNRWFGLHDQGWSFFVNRLAAYSRGDSLEDKKDARERGTLPDNPC